MSLSREIQHIKAQIIETEKMLQLIADHPIMSIAFKEKLESLRKQLADLPTEQQEPRIRMLFSGNAVKGSLGIKSTFVRKTLQPVQELIKTQTSLVRFGNVSKRGKAKRSVQSELFLTALPTGSFGFELSKLDSEDLFDEIDVATSIGQVISLIEATAESDVQFERVLVNTPNRSLNNLKKFFKEVAEEDSILKIESGSRYVQLSVEKVKEGYNRVSSVTTNSVEIVIDGTLRGVLLDSGRFEITDETGMKIAGYISPELSEEEIIAYDKQFLNKNCKIHLQVIKTKFKTGSERTMFELLQITT
ncbi:hypothetical protein SAMN05660909_05583 [Chitinophaga terrae (ex Kim and Jung 2007)]|uniref:Uncharacterized protein n=1 Tax=Chitinophaga terrae (ex Kim and Jung 2007) TaxID=408074 RepID=A0A1H4GQ23_9BACT|nr:hypothetical protein [Chitinophaga terrae (ex Kim and Jung 2007)]GEP93655.1 hypothetical protein CTE07_53000 [Chitinophaga terrae (ex Kim and Jung 2007)]SEB11421.1 hypothetical protein SAMN05660909_05583 [Chitinophaga terrae (ex Kim and Jung 2007)]